MGLTGQDISVGGLVTESGGSFEQGTVDLSEAAIREALRIEAEINLVGCDAAADVVTACYLCHGQCSNFGVHGKNVRPCARGVNSVLERHRKARRDRWEKVDLN